MNMQVKYTGKPKLTAGESEHDVRWLIFMSSKNTQAFILPCLCANGCASEAIGMERIGHKGGWLHLESAMTTFGTPLHSFVT